MDSSSFLEGKVDEGSLEGRILRKRDFGGLVFLTLKDHSGEVQISFEKDVLQDEFEAAKNRNVGDLIKVDGSAYETDKGVRTLQVEDFETVAECNRKMPDKYSGLNKGKARKNRGLELMVDSESMEVFQRRNQVVGEMRRYLFDEGFQEVDTGILHETTNTSPAEEFTTYSEYLDRDLFLRKTPELNLKKLLVGGMRNIFELGKNFRNEGISKEYHPEYTILELYQNDADYTDVLDLTTDMIEHLNETVYHPSSEPEDVVHVDMYPFLQDEFGINPKSADIDTILANTHPELRKDHGSDEELHKGFYVYDLFRSGLKNHEDKNLVLHGVPKEISVLGKTYDDEPTLVEEFRYFVKGNLICNGITELTDYDEQKRRIEQQAKTLDKSLDVNDNEFLELLSYGMPPNSGIGLGVEKVLMEYMEQDDIRDTIYFPL